MGCNVCGHARHNNACGSDSLPISTSVGSSSDLPSSTARAIPTNHIVVGTCGNCGGPVIAQMFYSGSYPIPEWCMDCGARPKQVIVPQWGPLKEMIE